MTDDDRSMLVEYAHGCVFRISADIGPKPFFSKACRHWCRRRVHGMAHTRQVCCRCLPENIGQAMCPICSSVFR